MYHRSGDKPPDPTTLLVEQGHTLPPIYMEPDSLTKKGGGVIWTMFLLMGPGPSQVPCDAKVDFPYALDRAITEKTQRPHFWQ